MTHTWTCAVTQWWQNPRWGDGPTPPPCTCGRDAVTTVDPQPNLAQEAQ